MNTPLPKFALNRGIANVVYNRARQLAGRRREIAAELTRGSIPRVNAPDSKLSPKEAAIVALLGDGMADKQIMEKLHITRGTLRTHLVRACRKWAALNRTHLVALCLSAEFKSQLAANLSAIMSAKRTTTGDGIRRRK